VLHRLFHTITLVALISTLAGCAISCGFISKVTVLICLPNSVTECMRAFLSGAPARWARWAGVNLESSTRAV
jgi:hypothetical protein